MPGLIEDQMSPGAGQMMPPGLPPGHDPNEPEGAAEPEHNPAEEQAEGESDGQALAQAIDEARKVLYGEEAAKMVAKALKAAKDLSDGAAQLAYDICMQVDHKVGGVPDEDVASLGVSILEEVCDIAEAAGMPLKNSEAARALRTMIVRFVQENGGDATDIEAAMKGVDENAFDKEDGDSDQDGSQSPQPPMQSGQQPPQQPSM